MDRWGQDPLSLFSSPSTCPALEMHGCSLDCEAPAPGAYLVTGPRHRLAPASVQMTLALAPNCILSSRATDAKLRPTRTQVHYVSQGHPEWEPPGFTAEAGLQAATSKHEPPTLGQCWCQYLRDGKKGWWWRMRGGRKPSP